jgi:oligopeptide transport system substrate-binding protein
MQTAYVGFDTSRPPFDDPRVRRAFALALDRETLADVVRRGQEFPATGGFIPPGVPGHSPGIGLPYDPRQAQQLLADAGYPGGRGFPAVDALTGSTGTSVEFAQAQWRENLGVEITWETMDWALYLDRLDKSPPHLFTLAWGADYPDPDNFLRSSSVQRMTRWRTEAYERLVEEARRTTEQGPRMKLYQEADRIMVEEAPILPTTYIRFHRLVKPWVRRLPFSPMAHVLLKDVIIDPH